MWQLAMAVAVIVGFTTICGGLSARLGQPAVVGEIVAGLILGPSVASTLAPGLIHALLPARVLPDLTLLAQAGLAIFMFTVGTELDLGALTRQRGVIATTSLSLMAVPFALGALTGQPLYSLLAGPSVNRLTFVIFLGTAISVSALPVLARIVQESGLQGSRLGSLSMLCAAVADVIGWLGLALALALDRAQGSGGVLRALALTIGLCAVCLFVVRPLLGALATHYTHAVIPTPGRVGLVLALILGLSAATDKIGVHLILGGLLAGLVLPKRTRVLGEVPDRIGSLNRGLLVPIFFASVGMQTNVRMAVARPTLLAAGALLLLIAVGAKFCAAVPVARAGGMPLRSALGFGVLMNVRGITDIVVLSAGLSAGIINRSAFTVLVMMALITTIMAAPALRLLGLTRRLRLASRPAGAPGNELEVDPSAAERMAV